MTTSRQTPPLMRLLAPIVVLAFAAGCSAPAADEPPPAAAPEQPKPSPTPAPSAPPATEPELPPLPTPEPPALPEGPTELRTSIAAGDYAQKRIEAARLVTITWTNDDDQTHSVVSDDGGFAGSGPIPPGGEFTRTFLTPGEYPFACRYHGNMAGIVLVR